MRKTLFATLMITLLFSVRPAQAGENDPAELYPLLDLFSAVLERVQTDYVEEVENRKLIESALNGMLSSLDPHSGYLSSDEYADMQVQTRGEFGGLGIEVTMDNGVVKVVSPIDDTPAYQAGLKPGDYITHLDGDSIIGLSLNQAVDRMRGRPGTKIRLSIRRANKEPFDVNITRAVIKIKSVRHRIEDNVGYIRITSFNEKTEPGVTKAIKEMRKELGKDLLGFVLDLRNNPGGLLDQAIAVSDMFLEEGEIVSTRSRNLDETQRFSARPGDLINNMPLVVMINDGSASASEIVAGALQDHGRAVLIGTKSFGKGSVQTVMPMPGQGAMRLTTARYYTPSGRSIQAKGIEPDIEVKPAKLEVFDKYPKRSEADLLNALDSEKKDNKDKNISDVETKEEKDYQLLRAIDLIKGLALYHKRQASAQ